GIRDFHVTGVQTCALPISDNDSALQIAFVYDDGSAAQNGLRRGDKIIEIEGVSVAQWLSRLDAGAISSDDVYGPNENGVVRNFEIGRASCREPACIIALAE